MSGIGGVLIRRLALLSGLGALGGLLVMPSVTVATHGGAGVPAVVESEHLASGSPRWAAITREILRRVSGFIRGSSVPDYGSGQEILPRDPLRRSPVHDPTDWQRRNG